jgi:hypothetical protein
MHALGLQYVLLRDADVHRIIAGCALVQRIFDMLAR